MLGALLAFGTGVYAVACGTFSSVKLSAGTIAFVSERRNIMATIIVAGITAGAIFASIW